MANLTVEDFVASCTDVSTWTTKKNYVPVLFTNSNSNVKCKKGFYKSCNLCLKDCSRLGRVNWNANTLPIILHSCQENKEDTPFEFQESALSLLKYISTIQPMKPIETYNVFEKWEKFINSNKYELVNTAETMKRINTNHSTKRRFIKKVVKIAADTLPSDMGEF